MLQIPVAEVTLSLTLETAKAAAFEAGEYLQGKRGSAQVLSKKALRDDLLDVDLKAEEIIISKLRADFPDYEILSEETVRDSRNTPYLWVVDPLDGSYNFQHGNPTFAISISLVIEGITTVGVVYLPLQKEIFTAIRGCGAELNDRRIHVSRTSTLNDSIIHVGDFAKDGNNKENKERINDIAYLADAVGRVRMIGTAATDLAYVACGRADGLVIHNAHPWDIAVGYLLVSEAGGKVTFLESELGKKMVISSNGHIHQELLNNIPQKGIPEKESYCCEYGPFVEDRVERQLNDLIQAELSV